MKNDRIMIAQIGRTVGLRGDLKLHIHTDFPEQFQPGVIFLSDRGPLEIATYNATRGTVKFVGYDTPEAARTLTNTKLYTTPEQTRETITLPEGEYFWFDIIGCVVMQGDETLGVVEEIDRLPGGDYLSIRTDKSLVDRGRPSTFLLPHIPRYIVRVDISSKRIETVDALDVLEAS
jgi:16S rRNA processing protein RimM